MNPTPPQGERKTPGNPGILPDFEPQFPSVAEQQDYWKRKEYESLDNKQLLGALDAFCDFLSEMNYAIGKLRQRFETISKPKP